eukprot:5199516-Alexandrium_andersonii.AAC.1
MSPATTVGWGGSTAARAWSASRRCPGGRYTDTTSLVGASGDELEATVASTATPSTSTREVRITEGRGTRMATPPCHPPWGPLLAA